MDAEMIDSVVLTSGPNELGFANVTFNRPDKANALNAALAQGFLKSIRSLEREGCKAIIIRGAGKNFCGGFDFDGYENASSDELVDRFVAIEESLQLLRNAPFVSIAIVQGAAFGAGADIVASSTYRLGADRARLRFPGFQFGVALGTRHLSRLIGMQNARQILLENAVVDCEEALRIGLLTHREQEDSLVDRAEVIAAASAALDPVAIQFILRLTSESDSKADMTELVASLRRPGLHERIGRYRKLSRGH
jgi:enoyl-CoA hydratase/carnithine racemase